MSKVLKQQFSDEVLEADYPHLPNDLNKHTNEEIYKAYEKYYCYASEQYTSVDMRMLCTESVLRSLVKKGYTLS